MNVEIKGKMLTLIRIVFGFAICFKVMSYGDKNYTSQIANCYTSCLEKGKVLSEMNHDPSNVSNNTKDCNVDHGNNNEQHCMEICGVRRIKDIDPRFTGRHIFFSMT